VERLQVYRSTGDELPSRGYDLARTHTRSLLPKERYQGLNFIVNVFKDLFCQPDLTAYNF
jgi:hypothetical protein